MTFVFMYDYGWISSWVFVGSIGILVVFLKPGGKTGHWFRDTFVIYPFLFLCAHSFRSIRCSVGLSRFHRSWRDQHVSLLVETEH